MTSTQPSYWERIFPIVGWLPRISAASFRSDLAAGLTTSVMLVPQAMAYAMLADLPPIVGLYASTVPLVLYALLGSSRQLAIGPMAMASLLFAAGLHEILPADVDVATQVATALLVTFAVGVIQIAMGVLRLGFLVNLLSHPVVSGFTGAAAIIIGASQLRHLFGLDVPRGGLLETLGFVGRNLSTVNGPTLLVGLLSIAIIVAVRRLAPRLPAALIAVLVGIALSYGLDLESMGVQVLGSIPSGLPTPRLPDFDLLPLDEVVPLGLTVALIGFMESISAAKTYARQNRYEVYATTELVSIGVANVGASMVGGYTVGGALSRTAVNAQAGARTPLAGVVTAVAIAITLAFFTPVFAYLPKPVLAAIILVAVAGLIDVPEAIHLWRVKRDDLVLLVITFLVTLFGTIELGIVIGVLCSLLWLIFTTTRPEIRTLGRVPETRSYRCVEHFPDAETFRRVLILRMDAQFFFGNVVYLKDTLMDRLEGMDAPVAVVLDASSMNGLDSTAADTFGELIVELRRLEVEVFISHLKGAVREVMRDTGLLDLLGDGHVFYEVDDAVRAAVRHRDAVESGITRDEEDFGPSDFLD